MEERRRAALDLLNCMPQKAKTVTSQGIYISDQQSDEDKGSIVNLSAKGLHISSATDSFIDDKNDSQVFKFNENESILSNFTDYEAFEMGCGSDDIIFDESIEEFDKNEVTADRFESGFGSLSNSYNYANNYGSTSCSMACGNDEPDLEFDLNKSLLFDDNANSKDSKAKSRETTSSQIDPITIEIESRILRFKENVTLCDYRFVGKLTEAQRNIIKKIARDNDLVYRVLGKGNDRAIALRKTEKFISRQKIVWEMKMQQKQKKSTASPVITIQNKCEVSPGVMTDNSCYAEKTATCNSQYCESIACGDEEPLDTYVATPAKRTVVKVERGMNTAPEGYFVCVYCESDVPEVIQSVHMNDCLAKYRAALKERKKVLLEEANRLEIMAARERQNRKKRRQRHEVEAKLRIEEEKLMADMTAWQKANMVLSTPNKPSRLASNDTNSKHVDDKSSLTLLEKVHVNDLDHLLSAAKMLDKKKDAQKESCNENNQTQSTPIDRAKLKKNLQARMAMIADRRK